MGRRPSSRMGDASSRGHDMPPQLSQFIFPVALIAAFWFLLIRPQQQRQKQQAEMLSHLEPGAEIVTIGGIFGTIVELGEERIRIAVVDGSELEIARQSVRSVVTSAGVIPELDESDAPDDSESPIADEDEGDA